jgi:GntR family transcriptional regulator
MSYGPPSTPGRCPLALTHRVARGTVRQALAVLTAGGLISTRKGTRRVVLRQPRLQAFTQLRSFSEWGYAIGEMPSGRLVDLVLREATALETERLGVERVYHLTRVRLLSDRPVMIERTAYPERVGALVAGMNTDHESITARLRELGIVFSGATHSLSAVAASGEDARLLGVRPRIPLMRVLRLSTDPAGVPLEWSEDRYLGEAVAFTVHNSARHNTLIKGRS